MKLFCTGSAAVVVECQRNFVFLPIKLQVQIRTARFLQMFAVYENSLCSLFTLKASIQLHNIFESVDSSISTACQLRNFIAYMNNSHHANIIAIQYFVRIGFFVCFTSVFD
jgi:hypothetical protein